jgi:DNA adenine methylase
LPAVFCCSLRLNSRPEPWSCVTSPSDHMIYSQDAMQRAQQAVEPAELVEDARPPLKWAGGKRWQVQHLREYWERDTSRRLVEPFCGGLAVTLGLMPERALLNDINTHVVNFYSWLKKGLVINLPLKKSETKYYTYRKQFNQLLADNRGATVEAASLFYYLNRTGYNGLCRFNASGGFNVPYGQYKTINYRKDFLEFRAVFANWEFTNSDFDQIPLQADDFVYADPPYDVEFTAYSKGGFGWEEQERTAQWLAKHRGPVILSNQATKRIKELYADLGYKLRFLEAPRRISCTGDRTPAPEVLALLNL